MNLANFGEGERERRRPAARYVKTIICRSNGTELSMSTKPGESRREPKEIRAPNRFTRGLKAPCKP